MIKFIILIGMLIFCLADTFAANPALIFGSGGYAKTIPANGIELSSGVRWIDLSADPTSVAVDAPAGSFGAFGTNIYIKQDAGSTLNWDLVSTSIYSSPISAEGDIIIGNALNAESTLPIGSAGQILTADGTTASWQEAPEALPLLGKGSIVTSDGVTNGEYTACGDDQLVQWDSTTATGIKCVDAAFSPTTATGDMIVRGAAEDEALPIGSSGQILTSDGTTAAWQEAPESLPLLGKGSIVTSDGTTNGEFTACADTEVLVFDAAAPSGFICGSGKTQLATKGDLLSFSTIEEILPVGTDGQNLVVDSTEPTGLKWEDELILGLGVLGKGSILTSDGTVNGEFEACGDGEILEWDSNETAGVKCVSKPVAYAGIGLFFGSNISPSPYSNSTISFTDLGVSNSGVVVPTGATVELSLVQSTTAGISGFAQNGSCTYQWVRNGTPIGNSQTLEVTSAQSIMPTITYFDNPPAGTYTYTVQARRYSLGDETCVVFEVRPVAKVYPQ